MRIVIILCMLSICINAFAQPGPVPQQAGFPLNYSHNYARLLVADIDGDGFKEIISFDTDDVANNCLYVFEHDGSVKAGWPITVGDIRGGQLTAGDIDGDGDLEMAWVEGFLTGTSTVQVVDHEGNLLHIVIAAFGLIEPSILPIVFADMNGDGTEEILIFDNAFWPNQFFFHAICGDGTSLPGWPVEFDLQNWPDTATNPLLFGCFSAGDFNYDNSFQLIFGSQRVDLHAASGPVFRVGGDGQSVAGYPRPETQGNYSAGIMVADFNQDGSCEHSGMGDQRYSISTNEGEYYNANWLPAGQLCISRQAAGQFDDDVDLELLVSTDNNYILDTHSQAGSPHVLQSNPNIRFYDPCVADIDGDGLSEVGGILQGLNYPFGVVDNELNFLPGWPVLLSSTITTLDTPTCVADLDNDGDLEMIVAVPEAIYAFDFPTPAGRVYWSGHNGNPAQNRFVDYRNYPNKEFVRGDANSDSVVDITDFALGLQHLLVTSSSSLCMPRFDVDGNEVVNLADSIAILNYLFVGTATIPEPFPACGKMPHAEYRKIYCLQSVCN